MRDVEVRRSVVSDSEQGHGEEEDGTEQNAGRALERLELVFREEHDACPFLKDKLTLPIMNEAVKCACHGGVNQIIT